MSRKEREVKELVVADDSNYVGSNLPVTQGDFEALSMQRKMLHTFINKELRQGIDFGIIPGTDKPSLYKPGAEKMKMLFGLGARFEVLTKELDRKENFLSYEHKCEIYHLKTGRVIAECIGSCNSQEKKYATRAKYEGYGKSRKKVGYEPTPVCDVQNTISKMSQKRAFVGAIILATGASDFFTQDMEDYDDGPGVGIPQEPEKKSQFASDDRSKRLKDLVETCRKVGISEKDICSKFSVKNSSELTDAQAKELGGFGRDIHSGTKTVQEIFSKG